MTVTSCIYSLHYIIIKLLKEKDKKDPSFSKIMELIDMAHIFLEKLYIGYDQIENDDLKAKMAEVVERIETLVDQT